MTADRLVIPDLAGKAVLITGASTGIGAAVARGFADQGASVAIGYHSSAEKAQALASKIKAAGRLDLAHERLRPFRARMVADRDNRALFGEASGHSRPYAR